MDLGGRSRCNARLDKRPARCKLLSQGSTSALPVANWAAPRSPPHPPTLPRRASANGCEATSGTAVPNLNLVQNLGRGGPVSWAHLETYLEPSKHKARRPLTRESEPVKGWSARESADRQTKPVRARRRDVAEPKIG